MAFIDSLEAHVGRLQANQFELSDNRTSPAGQLCGRSLWNDVWYWAGGPGGA